MYRLPVVAAAGMTPPVAECCGLLKAVNALAAMIEWQQRFYQ